MGLLESMLMPSSMPFHGVIPGKSVMPLERVCLPVTFGSKENYRTEHLQFEVTDFKNAYHTILGRPALAKFMAIPHYTYLVMKVMGPYGVLSLKKSIKCSFGCEKENCSLTEILTAIEELQEIKTDVVDLADESEVPSEKA